MKPFSAKSGVAIAVLVVGLVAFFWARHRTPVDGPPSVAFSGDPRCAHAFRYQIHFLQGGPQNLKRLGVDLNSRFDGAVTITPLAANSRELLTRLDWESGAGVYILQDASGFLFYANSESVDASSLRELWMAGAFQPFYSPTPWVKAVTKDTGGRDVVETSVWKGQTDSHGLLEKFGGKETGKVSLGLGRKDKVAFSRIFTAIRNGALPLTASAAKACSVGDVTSAMADLGLKQITAEKVFSQYSQKGSAPAAPATEAQRQEWMNAFTGAQEKQINAQIAFLTTQAETSEELVKDIEADVLKRVALGNSVDLVALNLIGVLAGAQSPASQRALGNVIDWLSSDRKAIPDYLEEAVRSSQFILTPLPETFSRLDALSKNTEIPPAARDAALLASGSLVSQLGNDQKVGSYVSELIEGARQNNDQAVVYVSALANTRTSAAKKALQSIAQSHPQEIVRGHAKTELKEFPDSSL